MYLAGVDDIPALNRWIAEHRLSSYWDRDGAPLPQFTPHLWRWSEIAEALDTAQSEPRAAAGNAGSIELWHPGLTDQLMMTLSLEIRWAMPGEHSPSRRETAAAVRFVIVGNEQAHTVVDGEPLPMQTHSLLTTPNWTMHGHANDSHEPVVWLQAVDHRLSGLGQVLYEIYRETEPESAGRTHVAPAVPGLRHLRPAKDMPERLTPACCYLWEDTFATLVALREAGVQADSCDGFRISYVHPLSGGPTLPTFAAGIQCHPAGGVTQAHRHNCTTFYYVVQGKGSTHVESTRLDWTRGDIFVLPPWTSHRHEIQPGEDAILLYLTDEPALSAFGFYREERVDPAE